MKLRTALISGLILSGLVYALPADAQVVREGDVKSIAGILNGQNPTAFWTFKSSGNQILFATLDADIYRMFPGGDDGHASTAAESGGGCSGEDEGGGPVRFYIEVKDSAGQQVCYAERPAPPPGWQRDPRLACVLPATGGPQLTYSVVVGLKAKDHDHEEVTMLAAAGPGHPFILNVSLRRIAPTGTNIQSAIAQSNNGL